MPLMTTAQLNILCFILRYLVPYPVCNLSRQIAFTAAVVHTFKEKEINKTNQHGFLIPAFRICFFFRIHDVVDSLLSATFDYG